MAAPAFDHPAAQDRIRRSGSPVVAALLAVGATVMLWQARARSRADLGRLDVTRHADLGLGAAEIRREVAKPFWRA